jgi:hypothetical protein
MQHRFFSMIPRTTLTCSWLLGASMTLMSAAESPTDSLAKGFGDPAVAYRPWVWAHWLHGNVDRASITRELTAIKRVGLGGLTMFDVAQKGIPAGPHGYMQPSWQDLFRFEIAEAKRLGLEIMTHNGPGYGGNGGPWMPAERAAQEVVSSQVRVSGGQTFRGSLPTPPSRGGWYRDIAVLAIQETEAQSNPPGIEGDAAIKRLKWQSYIGFKGAESAPLDAMAPAEICIPRAHVVNVTSRLKADGTMTWDAPPGEWTLLRLGHTWTGQETLPATPEGLGPECDKLDPRGIRLHFHHVMKRMVELGGPASGVNFHSFFADSWEAGGQNWTERMPEEFRKRRGYDPIPLLPILTGRVLDDLQTSERFLYDLRQTVSELATEHFWGEMHRLCQSHGMRLAAEAYITTGNDFDAANHLDEPMGELWLPGSQADRYLTSIKLAASSANLNGKARVGVESFTAGTQERWRSHPATLKPLADHIFSLGGNRLQVHRFAMQRFPQVSPGLMMGPWGTQYDSTQTWWEWTKPWHDYLARCQYLLSQGPIVTDVLDLAPEEPLWRFVPLSLRGYDYDACGPDTFRRMIVKKNGRTGLANGPDYALLRVSHQGTMTLARLKKLRELLLAGAHVLAEPPQSTPGLEGLPQADIELKQLVAELWGTRGETERRIGQGRLYSGQEPAAILEKQKIPADFSGPETLRWIHRRAGEADIYFIASEAASSMNARCTLRVNGKRAELWDAETGTIRPLATTAVDTARCRVNIPLGPAGSAFVVFRPGKTIESNEAITPQPTAADTFSIAAWADPAAEIELPTETIDGIAGLQHHRNDAVSASPGHQLIGEGHACCGVSIGQNGVVVYEHSASYYAPVLVHAAAITGWTHVAVVYRDGVPTLFLNGKSVHQGKKGPVTIHSPLPFSADVSSTFRGSLGEFYEFPEALSAEKIAQWIAAHPPATAGYELRGPWQVNFDPKNGGVGNVTFEQLEDWSKRREDGIRNYSGTALYQTTFEAPKIKADERLHLDLGQVAVMARVQLNGKDLGILWKPPYRIDVTKLLRPGANSLKIAVVNNWVNRMIGDAALPEDSPRNHEGVLQSWPEWLLAGSNSPTGRRTFVTIPMWQANDERVPSGLLGPVTLFPRKP